MCFFLFRPMRSKSHQPRSSYFGNVLSFLFVESESVFPRPTNQPTNQPTNNQEPTLQSFSSWLYSGFQLFQPSNFSWDFLLLRFLEPYLSNPSVEVPPSYQHHHHIMLPVAHWNQKQDLFGDMKFKVGQLGYLGGMFRWRKWSDQWKPWKSWTCWMMKATFRENKRVNFS